MWCAPNGDLLVQAFGDYPLRQDDGCLLADYEFYVVQPTGRTWLCYRTHSDSDSDLNQYY